MFLGDSPRAQIRCKAQAHAGKGRNQCGRAERARATVCGNNTGGKTGGLGARCAARVPPPDLCRPALASVGFAPSEKLEELARHTVNRVGTRPCSAASCRRRHMFQLCCQKITRRMFLYADKVAPGTT